MSWQDYVDNQLIASQCVSKACIAGHDGGVWAKSEGFEVSWVELMMQSKKLSSPEDSISSSSAFCRTFSALALWWPLNETTIALCAHLEAPAKFPICRFVTTFFLIPICRLGVSDLPIYRRDWEDLGGMLLLVVSRCNRHRFVETLIHRTSIT